MPRVSEDFLTHNNVHGTSFVMEGITYWTRAYSTWNHMKKRCSKAHLKTRPTYAGCFVSEEFKDFQNFAAWCKSQIGYGRSGYQLDKDILYIGNKEYGPTTCVFVPQALNTFMCSSDAIRGELPQGVTWDNKNRKYRVKVKCRGVVKHVGRYSVLSDAVHAYKCAKEAEAKSWAHELESGEFDIDMRVIEALKNWRFIEKDC